MARSWLEVLGAGVAQKTEEKRAKEEEAAKQQQMQQALTQLLVGAPKFEPQTTMGPKETPLQGDKITWNTQQRQGATPTFPNAMIDPGRAQAYAQLGAQTGQGGNIMSALLSKDLAGKEGPKWEPMPSVPGMFYNKADPTQTISNASAWEKAMALKAASRPTTTIENNMSPKRAYPAAPSGYRYEPAGDGTDNFNLVPIPGGPAERDIASDEAKAAAAEQERVSALEASQEQAGESALYVTRAADQAIDILDKSPNMADTAWVAGMTSGIPGTPAMALDTALRTMRASVGFDTLQAMRDASPTGGALGQVSQLELEQLNAKMADLTVGNPNLRENIKFVKGRYERILDKAVWYPNAEASLGTEVVAEGRLASLQRMSKDNLSKVLSGVESGTIALTAAEAVEAARRWEELNGE